MLKRALLSTLSLALGITLTTGGVASARTSLSATAHHNQGTVFYVATLTGANEVPAADPADHGRAVIRVTGTQVCFAESWTHLTTPTASHIHAGAAGVAGPVKVPLFAGAIPASISAVTGCTTSDAATLAAIKADPGSFYVNIHTPLFPAGAGRGQLRRVHDVDDLHVAFGDESNFAAFAKGANEVPVPGAPDSRAVGRFRITTDSVRFALTWRGFTSPFASHIHSGAAGMAGPVAIPFFATATTDGLPPTINGVTGSVTADPALLSQIRKNPAAFYFNLHTADFKAGVARGQLFRIG